MKSARRSEALREEMELHLAEKTAELEADGLTTENARAEARRRFGNVRLKNEESREIWMTRFASEFDPATRAFARRVLGGVDQHIAVDIRARQPTSSFDRCQNHAGRFAAGLDRPALVQLLSQPACLGDHVPIQETVDLVSGIDNPRHILRLELSVLVVRQRIATPDVIEHSHLGQRGAESVTANITMKRGKRL
jgi:hypothetical protein